jgi:hypothetical protein
MKIIYGDLFRAAPYRLTLALHKDALFHWLAHEITKSTKEQIEIIVSKLTNMKKMQFEKTSY